MKWCFMSLRDRAFYWNQLLPWSTSCKLMIRIIVWIENSNTDIAFINLSNKQGILIAFAIFFLLKRFGLIHWELYVNTRFILSPKTWTTWHDILAFSGEPDPTSVYMVVCVVRYFVLLLYMCAIYFSSSGSALHANLLSILYSSR